jgi:putative redox protein
MPSTLTVHATHQGDMRIVAEARGRSLQMDYPLSNLGGEGMTPLEALLSSLAGCSGNTLSLLLKKMSQAVDGIEVFARATRRDEHPTVLTDIALEFVVRGAGVQPSAVEAALARAEETVCPVWAMLKPSTRITSTYRLVER